MYARIQRKMVQADTSLRKKLEIWRRKAFLAWRRKLMAKKGVCMSAELLMDRRPPSKRHWELFSSEGKFAVAIAQHRWWLMRVSLLRWMHVLALSMSVTVQERAMTEWELLMRYLLAIDRSFRASLELKDTVRNRNQAVQLCPRYWKDNVLYREDEQHVLWFTS
eukprot:3829178-Amphidinium_carterae.1